MVKDNEIVMVVDKDVLFGQSDSDKFIGFRDASHLDYTERIIKNKRFIRHGDSKGDSSIIEPICYCFIINSDKKTVFYYVRTSDMGASEEDRLHGKLSCGVGGHIQTVDSKNPLEESILRELDEEVNIGGDILNKKLIGYINLEEDVHADHFGLLYFIETNANEVLPKDKEVEKGNLKHIAELDSMIKSPKYDVEEWTKWGIYPLKRHFGIDED